MANKGSTLSVEELYHHTDPSQFDFETTEGLDELEQAIGQPRAVEAVKFSTKVKNEGYNIYALGPTGLGKRELVEQFFQEKASSEPVPNSWCYVHNFEEEHKPKMIELPAGKAVGFRDDMDDLIDELGEALSAAFESEEYQNRRQSIREEFKEKQSEAFEELQQRAQREGMALLRTPAGLVVAPVRDGEVLSPDQIEQLSEEEQEEIQKKVENLQEDLQQILGQVPKWQRQMREELQELNEEIAQFAVGGLIDELKEKYSEFPEVVDHLEAVQKDVIENAEDFLRQEQGQQGGGLRQLLGQGGPQQAQGGPSPLRRYQVNVIIDRSEAEGAPVVYEDNPTYQNLIGRIEHRAQMGALFTDFNMIKAGSLHKANGGYLVLDVRKVLTNPYAWDALKRALKSKELRIESLGQRLSLLSTVSLEPEPIPLNVKIALVGNRLLYYLLHQLDPEFAELFKVQADFETQMDRDTENSQLYAQLIGTLARQKELRPLNREAVSRVIERSARLVGDSEKLSTKKKDIADLLCEANVWAEDAGRDVITAEDVQKAIDAQVYRADRIRERMQEAILRETILIDTEGEEVGQINGLSVIPLSDFAFGRPTRITAQMRLGKGEVIDIEREVELGGPIHSKGVMILSGFLGGRYSEEKPLSLSASLVFEQSYGGVEGDSASSAELYALLSEIAEVPIKQSMAVTGSVNQHGKIQPIGGVNEKIEGFFDICKARGLTGDQGVLIPVSNVKHLMLRQDVIDAVTDGEFHIYPVETVDQGIEILTGLPAGERDEEGNYPEGSVNYLVEKRLRELAETRAQFGESGKETEGE